MGGNMATSLLGASACLGIGLAELAAAVCHSGLESGILLHEVILQCPAFSRAIGILQVLHNDRLGVPVMVASCLALQHLSLHCSRLEMLQQCAHVRT